MVKHLTSVCTLCLAAHFLLSQEARCQPLAFDTFEYGAGNLLDGQDGGHGWDGKWTSLHATITDESISYSHQDLTKGGGCSLKVDVNGDRTLSRNVFPAPDRSGAPVFVSFIFQVKSSGATGEVSGEVFSGWQCKDGQPDLKVDNIGMTGLRGSAGARVNNQSKMISTPLLYGTTYFLVIKYGDWDGTQYTSTTVWLNPGPADEDMVDSAIRARVTSKAGSEGFLGLLVRTFGLKTGTSYLFDDVCVGRTWADVTSAPLKQ